MNEVVREAEVAIEVVLLGMTEDGLTTLLRPLAGDFAREGAPPVYALPRGRPRVGERLDDAAARIIATELGLGGLFVEQLYTFMRTKGSPLLRVAYYALVDARSLEAARLEEEAAGEPRLVPLNVPGEGETGGPVEALDPQGAPYALPDNDEDVLGMAVKRVRGKLTYTPIGYQLLPDRFTLLELQQVHETVLGRPFNKISFRRRMLGSGELEATGERQRDVGHRPAELYRFRSRSAV